jgi:hypothetical protein
MIHVMKVSLPCGSHLDNSPVSCVLVLLVVIDVVIIVVVWVAPLPSFYIKGGRGYKESL